MLSQPMLTTHEVADLLKVGEATVRSWIHDGHLRAIRFGREFRVPVRDLEAFCNARATRPPDAAPPDAAPPDAAPPGAGTADAAPPEARAADAGRPATPQA